MKRTALLALLFVAIFIPNACAQMFLTGNRVFSSGDPGEIRLYSINPVGYDRYIDSQPQQTDKLYIWLENRCFPLYSRYGTPLAQECYIKLSKLGSMQEEIIAPIILRGQSSANQEGVTASDLFFSNHVFPEIEIYKEQQLLQKLTFEKPVDVKSYFTYFKIPSAAEKNIRQADAVYIIMPMTDETTQRIKVPEDVLSEWFKVLNKDNVLSLHTRTRGERRRGNIAGVISDGYLSGKQPEQKPAGQLPVDLVNLGRGPAQAEIWIGGTHSLTSSTSSFPTYPKSAAKQAGISHRSTYTMTNVSGTSEFWLSSSGDIDVPLPSSAGTIKNMSLTLEHRLIEKGIFGLPSRYYLTIARGTRTTPDALFGDKKKLPSIGLYNGGVLIQTVSVKQIMKPYDTEQLKIMLKEPDMGKIQQADAAHITIHFDNGGTQTVKLPDGLFSQWAKIADRQLAVKAMSNTNAERKAAVYFSRMLDPYDVDPQ